MNKLAVDIGPTFKSPFQDLTDVGTLTSRVVANALVIAGFLLLVLLIFGGFSMIMGAGSNNPDQASSGRKAATAAVAGFVIIFVAYWIVQIIQTLTGISILGNP